MFAKWPILPPRRTMFMNSSRTVRRVVRQNPYSSNLANIVHEQFASSSPNCSSNGLFRNPGEHGSWTPIIQLFANSSPNNSPKYTAIFGIENRKITVSSSHYGTVRYTINDLNIFYGKSLVLSVCQIVRRVVREQLYNWCSWIVFANISK